jgi:hypothetical protein
MFAEESSGGYGEGCGASASEFLWKRSAFLQIDKADLPIEAAFRPLVGTAIDGRNYRCCELLENPDRPKVR